MKLLPLFIIVALTGCKPKSETRRFIDYINDPRNKITQHIKAGETDVTVKWLSNEERKLKVGSPVVSTGTRNPVVSTDDGFRYFKVVFEKNTGDKPDKQKTLYLNFDIQKDFVLLERGDSVLPAICQKIENGKPGSYEYMVAFEKPLKPAEMENGFTLIYKDNLFSIGTLAFVYKQEDIQRIPKIKNTEE